MRRNAMRRSRGGQGVNPSRCMIAWFATKGSGTNEARRVEALLSDFSDKKEWIFDKRAKRGSFCRLINHIRRERPSLIVMEGTGIAGGLACLAGRWVWRAPYVFSSGDAIAPFVRGHSPWFGWLFEIYERLLCRWCAGFIGWTPYLCGRAMTFGAPRAVSAPGWACVSPATGLIGSREKVRRQWGIPENHLVFGIAGALDWNDHRQFCYGWDLVQAARRIKRTDVSFLVVGEGSGLERLRAAAGDLLGSRFFLPGPVPQDEVMNVLSAMDVGSLPQSLDGVGMFRFTTKISEYIRARLPVITTQIPMAYDLGIDWMWRIPGDAPWDEVYLAALSKLIDGMTWESVTEHRESIPVQFDTFERGQQVRRVGQFIHDILQGARCSVDGRNGDPTKSD